MTGTRLEERVVRVAEAALEAQGYVSPVDVLLRIGWLAPTDLDRWRQGRVECLEGVVQAGLGKQTTAMQELRAWAGARGLRASETAYRARTRDRRELRFSVSGRPEIERAYRTHWVSPKLSERKAERLTERVGAAPDLLVIAALNPWTCRECATADGDLLLMEGDGPVCMRCARLDHLVFLPSGDAGLTRRARRGSELAAVVVRFSRTRKRYERQGLLVEPAALAAARKDPSAGGRTPACPDDPSDIIPHE